MASSTRIARRVHASGWHRSAPVVMVVAAAAFVLWRLVRADRAPAGAARAVESSDDRRAPTALPPPRFRATAPERALAHATPPPGTPLREEPPPGSAGPGPHLMRYGGRSGQLPPT